MTDSDEAFYAEAAREMVESGDWLTPHYNYEPRFQKPILYYWATAATFAVTGPGEASARLWAAVSGIALVFVTAGIARRWYDDDTALLAGAIVATSFGYVALGRMALPDLPLALFVTATIGCALVAVGDRVPRPRQWLIAAAVAAALGFLTKGPLALVLPAVVIGPIVAIERRQARVGLADLAAAAGVFVVVAAPWYLAMWWRHGTPYLDSFFVGDNFERFATDRFNEPRPWWYYGPVIRRRGAVVALPAARRRRLLRLLTGRGGPAASRRALPSGWRCSPSSRSRSASSRATCSSLLPPLALLLAHGIMDRVRSRRGLDGGLYQSRPDRGLQSASIASGAILMLAGALLWRARPLFVELLPLHSAVAAVVIMLAGPAVVATALTRLARCALGARHRQQSLPCRRSSSADWRAGRKMPCTRPRRR
jgi:hypothetical protein